MRALLLVLVIALAGCASEPVERIVYQTVRVPVYVRPEPPAELAAPYKPVELPVFLPPGQGVVSLDAEGVNALKTIIRTLSTRDEAWREWSKPNE